MKKYIVVALSVGAMSNKIFESGDIVNEDAFPEGHAEKLVGEGFLKPYDESASEAEKTPEDVASSKDKKGTKK
jgi:hypothetical protein